MTSAELFRASGFEGAAAPEAEAKSGWAAAGNGGGGAPGSPGQSRHDVTSVAFDGALWTRGGALGPHGDLTLSGPSQGSGTSGHRRSSRHEALGPHSDLTLTGDTPRFAALAPAQHRYGGYTHHHDDGVDSYRSDDARRAQALGADTCHNTHARAPDAVEDAAPARACNAAVDVTADPLLLGAQRSPIAAVAARHVLNVHSRAGADVPQTSKPDIT